jgi:superfamily I DNA and RNA helicase
MSLWWTARNQLDERQIELIEEVPLQDSRLVVGPPGSGKTNVLLRRAQFVRSQGMSNVLVLTFTRPLTEFVKTGCYDGSKEIFPPSLVTTMESWIRSLYRDHSLELPGPSNGGLSAWKRALAKGALGVSADSSQPPYDTIFVDEAQDLFNEEIDLIREWTDCVFFTGDTRQKIYADADGIPAINTKYPNLPTSELLYHYRLAPELCRVADKILKPQAGSSLSSTGFYTGPKPGHAETHGPLQKSDQIRAAIERIESQLRVYSTLIEQGDRIGIIVPEREDRNLVFRSLEEDFDLEGLSQVVRAKDDSGDHHNPAFDPSKPISIVTEAGCKGLEFRAVHWLFADKFSSWRSSETYYTVITRAKTSIDIYYEGNVPNIIAKACSPEKKDIWA